MKPDVESDTNADAGLRKICDCLGMRSNSHSGKQFGSYLTLLEKWNQRINLTASTSWNALEPFFREAIYAAELYPEGIALHLDIGSGAGFPALLIKILRPEMRLTMVESRMKRSVFLQTAICELQLRDACVANCRLEEFLKRADSSSGWDFISWKGIKLGMGEIKLLIERSKETAQIWIFHGKKLPVEDPPGVDKYLRLRNRHALPWNRNSFLSIYQPNR